MKVKYVGVCNVIPVRLKVQNGMCNTLSGIQAANLKMTVDWYQIRRKKQHICMSLGMENQEDSRHHTGCNSKQTSTAPSHKQLLQ